MNIGTLQHTPVDALSPKVPLEALAGSIRAEHARYCASFRNAIGHALEAGRLLLEAKSATDHGRWLAWLTTHCELAERTAQGYMRLAKNSVMLLEGDPQRVADLADLSVRGAAKLLAKHKSPDINPAKAQDAVRSERESLNKIKALGKRLEQQRDCVLFLWTPAPTNAETAALVDQLVESSRRSGFRICVGEGALMVMRSKGCAAAPLEPPASVSASSESGGGL